MKWLTFWMQRARRYFFGREEPVHGIVQEATSKVALKGECHKKFEGRVLVVPGREANPGWMDEYIRSRMSSVPQEKLDELDAAIEKDWDYSSTEDVPIAVFLEGLDEKYKKLKDEEEEAYKTSFGIPS